MGAEGEKLGTLADEFTKQNPNITVKVTPITWDVAHQKLITSVAGRQTPDVSQLGTTWMAEFGKLGALDEVQGIPQETYEAARMDGAGRWQEFRHVTLPLLRPTLAFVAVVSSAGYLQLFEEPFVMTGGGPVDRTISVAMHMYEQGFGFFNLGYAGAIAYVLFVAILVLTVLQLRLFRSAT